MGTTERMGQATQYVPPITHAKRTTISPTAIVLLHQRVQVNILGETLHRTNQLSELENENLAAPWLS